MSLEIVLLYSEGILPSKSQEIIAWLLRDYSPLGVIVIQNNDNNTYSCQKIVVYGVLCVMVINAIVVILLKLKEIPSINLKHI